VSAEEDSTVYDRWRSPDPHALTDQIVPNHLSIRLFQGI
jgi:hypothetical protein